MSKIGETIRVLRIKRGYSQAQLAELMGLKRSAISNYEQGIREPDLDTVEAFADFFDVSVADLMGRDERDFNSILHENINQISVTDKDDDIQKLLSEEHNELWQMREDMRRNPELRALYDLQRKATKAELTQMTAFIKAIRSSGDDTENDDPA